MNKTFSIKKSISFGWNKFWENPWFWILAYGIVFGVTFSMSNMFGRDHKSDTNQTYMNSVNTTEISKTMEYNLPENMELDENTVNTNNIINSEMQKLETMGNKDNFNYLPLIIGAVFATPIILAFALLTYLVKQILSMGYVHLTLDATRNKKLDYKTILSEVNIKKAFKLMVASALYGLYIIVGLILFIIPGIYIALKYFFVYYLIIDKDLSIKEAFKLSGEMTKGIKIKLLGLSITMAIVTFLGLLVFIIGVIPASIICTLAIAYTYEDLANTVKAKK